MSIAGLLTLVACLFTSLSAQDATKPAATPAPAATADAAHQAKPYHIVAAYPLGTCVVSDEELDADAVTFEAGGRTFKTCCKKCKAKVEKDPETFAAKLDAAIVAQQSANYPLTTCPVSGKKLGAMGEPEKLVLAGTLVELCCDGCIKKAKADPAAMAGRVLDAAYAAQATNYPLKTCVASGEKLGADTYDVMYGTRLVRFCCKDCVGDLEKDPATILSKLDAAAAKSAPADEASKEKPAATPKKKDGAMAEDVGLTSTKAGKSGSCCGETCVDGATGGCCKDGASEATKKPAKSEAGGCCETGAEKQVEVATKPVQPVKKID